MHVVLIRFSSMGDVVLQSALIAWLKLKIPKIKITFVTSEEFKGLVEGHDFVDHVITHQRKSGLEDIRELKRLSNQIKALKPDCIIDLHNTLRAKLVRFFCKSIPSVKVYKRTMLRNILVWLKLDFLKSLKSHHERVIEDFKFLFSADYEREELEDFLTKTNLTTIPLSFESDIKNTYSGDYIVISPVASFEPKRWPAESFNELTKLLLTDSSFSSYKFLIVGGPSDNYCQQIESTNERVINLQGQTSLSQTNEILSYAKLVITNDTGVGHMAEALGVDVISIFGPTSPSFGFRPHRPNSKVLYANVSCSPCSATGSKACSKKSLLCMEAVTPAEILENITSYFQGQVKC